MRNSHDENRGLSPIAADEPERAKERLLGDVLGGGAIAGEVSREPVDLGLIHPDELLERGQVALARARQGARIGLLHSLSLSILRRSQPMPPAGSRFPGPKGADRPKGAKVPRLSSV